MGLDQGVLALVEEKTRSALEVKVDGGDATIIQNCRIHRKGGSEYGDGDSRIR